MTDTSDADSVRSLALARIKARREFVQHLVAFAVINGMLIAIWATTGAGYFWPVWPLAGWGVGLLMHAWQVYQRPISEDEIRREMDRFGHRPSA